VRRRVTPAAVRVGSEPQRLSFFCNALYNATHAGLVIPMNSPPRHDFARNRSRGAIMSNRSIFTILAFFVCAVIAGCNRGGPAPPPKGFVPPPRPSEIARRDMLKVAKRIEDAANYQALEQYVANFEDPEKGWTWSDLSEYVVNGSYSFQTKNAYEAWRRVKIIEGKK